jgi:hypothetical protein
MDSRKINVVLLGLCLALLGIIGYLIYVVRISPTASNYLVPSRIVTNTVTQIAVRKINSTNLLLEALAGRPLSWAAIESTNYATYITNLHNFSVPDETVRDIIITDVAKLYARRRAALRRTAPPYRFWQTGEDLDSGGRADPTLQGQLRELDKEQRTLIRELLGVDLQTEMAKYWNGEDDTQERLYGFLPQQKREQLKELQDRYDDLQQEIYARSKGLLLDEDQEQLKKLEKAKKAELAQILTPEEQEEYYLRNSSTANSLRYQLSGFNPNEDEFRRIFRLQKTFDDEFGMAFDTTDDTQIEVRSLAQQDAQDALNDEIKKVLGEKRYNEYQRAQDADYKALIQLADRFEMPQDVANKVYDMKLEAEKQKQRIERVPNLSEEQRQNVLAAVARETEKSIAQVLGEKTFKAYRHASGQWINNLSISSEPPAAPAPLPPEPPP